MTATTPSPGFSSAAHDFFLQGFEYLTEVRQLAFSPDMIETAEAIGDRIRICTWIGESIGSINLMLNAYLHACHQCFEPADRPEVRVLAAPLASDLGIDGLCNLWVNPTVILVDVGRVLPQDWLCIVAHEYAHAYLQSPGHDQRFLEVINHLGLGLDLPPISATDHLDAAQLEQALRTWPICSAQEDSLAFWRGESLYPPLKDWLLANTKAAEDLIQHGFCNLFSGDFAQGLNGSSQVNTPEVEGQGILNCGLHLL